MKLTDQQIRDLVQAHSLLQSVYPNTSLNPLAISVVDINKDIQRIIETALKEPEKPIRHWYHPDFT